MSEDESKAAEKDQAPAAKSKKPKAAKDSRVETLRGELEDLRQEASEKGLPSEKPIERIRQRAAELGVDASELLES